MTGYKYPSHQTLIAECRTCGPPNVFKHQGIDRMFQDYSSHIRGVTVCVHDCF